MYDVSCTLDLPGQSKRKYSSAPSPSSASNHSMFSTKYLAKRSSNVVRKKDRETERERERGRKRERERERGSERERGRERERDNVKESIIRLGHTSRQLPLTPYRKQVLHLDPVSGLCPP